MEGKKKENLEGVVFDFSTSLLPPPSVIGERGRIPNGRAVQGTCAFALVSPWRLHRIEVFGFIGYRCRLLQAGAAAQRLNRRFCRRRRTATQPAPVDDRQISCVHRSGAVVAHDQCPVDDIARAFFDIQVDPDLHAVADGEMDQRPVGAVLADLKGPKSGVDETGPIRKEVLQEDGAECDVAVIGNGDSIDGHVVD